MLATNGLLAKDAAPRANGSPSTGRAFQQLKAEIHQKMVEMIDISRLEKINQEQLRRQVRNMAIELAQTSVHDHADVEQDRLVDEIMNETFGLGPLQGLVSDPAISDILVNGPDAVYIERNGQLEETDIVFANDDHLLQIIQRIAARIGRRVDETSPMVDARLPDGSRVNAIIPPLSLVGPVLSIRRFGVRLATNDLLANHTLPAQMLKFLHAAVESRQNILISGGTGAGKTTLLNTFSQFIPTDERVVTIEDSAELRFTRKHVIHLETRTPNIEGVGQFTQRELVRNSLRMRPDRIIIGEVRGPEALDMLQAMNTGHEGSLTTIHANDTRDALTRLETMVVMAGFEMPLSVIRNYVASAIRLIVHISRLKGGSRKIMRVSEIVGLKKRRHYVLRELFGFRQTGVQNGKAVGEFYAAGNKPKCLSRITTSGIVLPEELFLKQALSPSGEDAEPFDVTANDLITE